MMNNDSKSNNSKMYITKMTLIMIIKIPINELMAMKNSSVVKFMTVML